MSFKMLLTVGAAMLLAAGSADAGPILAGQPVANLGTFVEDGGAHDGRIWLRLDNFSDPASPYAMTSFLTMKAPATAAGFTVATTNDVKSLLDRLPLTAGEYATYLGVMGSADPYYSKGIIEGMMQDTVDSHVYGLAFAFSNLPEPSNYGVSGTATRWYYYDPFLPESGGASPAAKLWAYMDAPAAPGPTVPDAGSTLLLLGMSAAGLVAARRRRR